MEQVYLEAYKKGTKEYKNHVSKGEFPYLPVLDDILKENPAQTEEKLGLMAIPLNNVVGTVTEGRTQSFTTDFLPIMDPKTEFAQKWNALARAQEEEGIRDPIKAYEYLNRYYVLEGNKRVSVLKYYGATQIYANVIRKVPKLTNEPKIKTYYELIDFMRITGINIVEFSKEGHATKLLKLIGKETAWDDMDREIFKGVCYRFEEAFNRRGGRHLNLPLGSALYAFVNVFTWKRVLEMSAKEYSDAIHKTWNEYVMLTEHHTVDLVLDPKENSSTVKSVIKQILPIKHKKWKTYFLYPKTPADSQWIYSHELGRQYLEQTFSDEVETRFVTDVTRDNVEEILEKIIADGADIIFEVGPQLAEASLEVAALHPNVKILNCSLNTESKQITTYYARMYEGKFISGMVAGALTTNDRIAYVADYPIYGMIANINAFALGAQMTNPRVKVYLDWSTKKNYDLQCFLHEHDIQIVSDQDMIKPSDPTRMFGLYRHHEDGTADKLVMPAWNWGEFYTRLLRSIMSGSYETETKSEIKGAVNYWWGMSAGVIDIVCAKQVPAGVQKLMETMRRDVLDGRVKPFSGQLIAQNGEIKDAGDGMSPRQIMKMDYLVENIVGTIPAKEEFTWQAQPVIETKGIEEVK